MRSAGTSSAWFVTVMRQCWKCLLDVQTFFYVYIILQNYFVSSKAEQHFDWKTSVVSTFGDDRRAELMQSKSSRLPEVSQEYRIPVPIPTLSSIIQSAKPHCCKVTFDTKKDTVDEHTKKEKGGIWGLNTIRWQTCPLMKNGNALQLAWTIDEVHMVYWGLKLCSPKSTGREWWAQLALLHILKWLNCHHINCKQLISKWIFHTFTGVFNIQHSQRGKLALLCFLFILLTARCWN